MPDKHNPIRTFPHPDVSEVRRRLLKLSPLVLLAGCDYTAGGGVDSFLTKFQKFNDWVQAKVFSANRLSPEVSDAELTPEDGFRLNSYDTDEPEIDLEGWKLSVTGLVSKPGEYTLAQIESLPKKIMNTKHCCVEGWSINVKWGGTPLAAFLDSVGADPAAKYVYVECGDGYYTTYDMPSARHPQTLLSYEAYGKPLALGHGAPVRITMPVKLGYKSAKWIKSLVVADGKTGGYWEDQGYDWFAGL
jgi:DMSO/TMAO reductase YedYZ molybdopterin-dependent catalytic subunit